MVGNVNHSGTSSGKTENKKFLLFGEEISEQPWTCLVSCLREFGSVIGECTFNHVAGSPIEASDYIFLFPKPRDDSWNDFMRHLTGRYFKARVIAMLTREFIDCSSGSVNDVIDDVIILPAETGELRTRIVSILSEPDLSETETLKDELSEKFGLEMFVGQSKKFLSVVRKIRLASRSCANVLISGETGTGKELITRAIHYLGNRSSHPFIPVNCGAIPETLFENEFFGHCRGAYTGATETREGLIEEAKGGTLFLDEINTLSIASQVKLLRFLEDRTYRTLGSSKNLHSDVRIISACNVDLTESVQRREFRQDLLYRVKILDIFLPPLRERSEDIPFLARHFLEKVGKVHGRFSICFSSDAIQKLTSYSWPGNVRELQHIIEKAVLFSNANLIKAGDFEFDRTAAVDQKPFNDAKQNFVNTFERDYLLEILEKNNWNVSKSAASARKDRRTFQRLMKKHGISVTASY